MAAETTTVPHTGPVLMITSHPVNPANTPATSFPTASPCEAGHFSEPELAVVRRFLDAYVNATREVIENTPR
ncbi:hypothetical protein [Amycolatopsis sp. Hca4]|uniref:hypothetical protein n=1 Tax=Amycolatopsis sp. Hca4 TaxID=2742131 RepID=UPI001592132C|nr:hypothetical protein [Amycolatopsis sp. Hca4]QKV80451.1 hypothetical protein HUT10_46730 [Amycolatopsis sp. Hca4]